MTHPSSAVETSPGRRIALAAAGEIVEIIVLAAHDTPTNCVAIAGRTAIDFPPAEPLLDEATSRGQRYRQWRTAMQPYTAVDLLIAMHADLGDGAPSHPDAPSCARSRSALVRMMAS